MLGKEWAQYIPVWFWIESNTHRTSWNHTNLKPEHLEGKKCLTIAKGTKDLRVVCKCTRNYHKHVAKQFQTVTKVWKWCFKAGSCHKAIANAFTRTPTFLFATTLDKVSSSDKITSTKSPKHQWLSGQGKAMIGQKKTFHNWSDPCGGGWSWVATRSSARESPRAWTAAVEATLSTWCAPAPGTTSASASTMCSKPTYFRYFYSVLIST